MDFPSQVGGFFFKKMEKPLILPNPLFYLFKKKFSLWWFWGGGVWVKFVV